MKEDLSKKQPINSELLELSKIYFTSKNQLVQIKKINLEKNELHLLNLTDQCIEYKKIDNHNLVKYLR